ncbi:DUF4231 domain-containing protein [Microbispora sp. ATCC PTA-5024]|uniref:DUF4231 domain-containing protein n=1 Tax=Microbispora sp. ATCC PTA-5024 TaxID=316330 RepID=UPI0003DCBF08|nr:DUF4231 domain-containing protein [Microbispora sp. ATCC PTA-5024]ETK37479.1 hypothetical protein MPTA5024_03780 [Microbispora sp. ATCC PTA-5024]
MVNGSAPDDAAAVALTRVTGLRDWYARQAARARLGHRGTELGVIVLGAAVPLTAALGLGSTVAAVLGAGVVVLTGVRGLYQWHENWLAAIDAQLSLETELALFAVGASPYDGPDRAAVLIRTAEAVKTADARQWSSRRRAARLPDGAGAGSAADLS